MAEGERPIGNRVVQGDCVKVLKTLPEGSVDLAFADPPFNIGYRYDLYHDRKPYHDYLDWSKQWIKGVARVLKPNGTFWLAIGDEFAAELKLVAQNDAGFQCRSWVIWYYTFGVHCYNKFARSHAHLFHFVRDPADFTFHADDPAVRVPSARQLVYADARANPKGKLPDDTWIMPGNAKSDAEMAQEEAWKLPPHAKPTRLTPKEEAWVLRPQDVPETFRKDEDTWYFSRVAGTFHERAGWHGCQMPEQLLARIIRVSSSPGDLVLDPFAGSGTTLAVAKKLGRDYIGVDLSPGYAEQVGKRLDAITAGDPIAGVEDPRTSAPSTAKGRTLDDLERKRKVDPGKGPPDGPEAPRRKPGRPPKKALPRVVPKGTGEAGGKGKALSKRAAAVPRKTKKPSAQKSDEGAGGSEPNVGEKAK